MAFPLRFALSAGARLQSQEPDSHQPSWSLGNNSLGQDSHPCKENTVPNKNAAPTRPQSTSWPGGLPRCESVSQQRQWPGWSSAQLGASPALERELRQQGARSAAAQTPRPGHRAMDVKGGIHAEHGPGLDPWGSEQRGPGSSGHTEVNHFTAAEPAVIPSSLPVTARKGAFRFWGRAETL